jgi:hypothetical protein
MRRENSSFLSSLLESRGWHYKGNWRVHLIFLSSRIRLRVSCGACFVVDLLPRGKNGNDDTCVETPESYVLN